MDNQSISSFPKKMSKPIANKTNIVALNGIDACWNNAFIDFRADQVDGQESLNYDELDPGDDATTTHDEGQVVVAIKTNKPSVSNPNIALASVYSAMSNVALTILSSGVNSQGAHELLAIFSPIFYCWASSWLGA